MELIYNEISPALAFGGQYSANWGDEISLTITRPEWKKWNATIIIISDEQGSQAITLSSEVSLQDLIDQADQVLNYDEADEDPIGQIER